MLGQTGTSLAANTVACSITATVNIATSLSQTGIRSTSTTPYLHSGRLYSRKSSRVGCCWRQSLYLLHGHV